MLLLVLFFFTDRRGVVVMNPGFMRTGTNLLQRCRKIVEDGFGTARRRIGAKRKLLTQRKISCGRTRQQDGPVCSDCRRPGAGGNRNLVEQVLLLSQSEK